MAYIVCQKHGGAGAAAVCAHVAARVDHAAVGASRETERLFPVRVTFKNTTLGPTWLCAECAKAHGVPEKGLHLHGDEGLERYWEGIGFVPVCPQCFKERYVRAER